MTPADPALEALLETGVFVDCDLYTLTLFGGGVLRYTTADINIRFGVDVWSAEGPRIDDPNDSAHAHWAIGLDVDTWQVRVMPRTLDPFTSEAFPDKIGGVGWIEAAANGALDGATLTVQRAFLAEWPTPWRREAVVDATGVLPIFTGRVADIDIGQGFAFITANDFRELLTIQMPRNLYQSGCRHTLFDAGCGLDRAAFDVAGAVGIGSAANRIKATLPFAAGYFDLGRLVMTEGPNTTFGRQVLSWDGDTLKIRAAFPFPITVGQTFTVYPGCDRMAATCLGKFGNLVNFGGQRFIPSASTAI